MSVTCFTASIHTDNHLCTFCRQLTEKEVVLQGLLGHKRAPSIKDVNFGPPKGRGIVTTEGIKKGAYVCEYRTYRVYPARSAEAQALKEDYEKNNEGSYVLETAYAVPGLGQRICFDATRRFRDLGRLINHAPAGSSECNLKAARPYFVRNKWRVGLVALRDITPGEEICYDYVVRGESWMGRARRGGGGSGKGGSDECGAPSSKADDIGVEAGAAGCGSGSPKPDDVVEVVARVEGDGGSEEGDGGCLADSEMAGSGLESGDLSEFEMWGEEDGGLEEGASSELEMWVEKPSAEDGGDRGSVEDGTEEDRDSGPKLTAGGTEEDNDGEEDEELHHDAKGGASYAWGGMTPSLPKHKRNYYWCPLLDCTSGPVQKITQHLQKKHRLSVTEAAQLAKKKRRAPVEAVRMKIPNPHTRSSGMKSLALTFGTPQCPPKHSPKPTCQEWATRTGTTPARGSLPMAAPSGELPAVTKLPPSFPRTSSATPTAGGGIEKHHTGLFVSAFESHLLTRAGGHRSPSSAQQLARYVGKYLFYLNEDKVDEMALLDPRPLEQYLDHVESMGIRSPGILQRLLSLKYVIHFMRLTVSTFALP